MAMSYLRPFLMGGLRHMSEAAGEKVSIATKIRPTNLERRFLVWAGKYKTTAEVPEYVSLESIEKSKSKARIRTTNGFIIFAVIGSVASIMMGKRDVERGESIQKSNLEWHQKVKDDFESSKKQ